MSNGVIVFLDVFEIVLDFVCHFSTSYSGRTWSSSRRQWCCPHLSSRRLSSCQVHNFHFDLTTSIHKSDNNFNFPRRRKAGAGLKSRPGEEEDTYQVIIIILFSIIISNLHSIITIILYSRIIILKNSTLDRLATSQMRSGQARLARPRDVTVSTAGSKLCQGRFPFLASQDDLEVSHPVSKWDGDEESNLVISLET